MEDKAEFDQLFKTYGVKWVMEKLKQGMEKDVEHLERQNLPTFLEVETVEQANRVDMQIYRLVNYSDRQGKYIFCRRARK